jgi:hypothetical protein
VVTVAAATAGLTEELLLPQGHLAETKVLATALERYAYPLEPSQQPSSPWLRLTFAGAAPSFSSVIPRSSLACDILQLRRITPCFWSLAISTSSGGLEQTNTKLTPTSGLTEQTR